METFSFCLGGSRLIKIDWYCVISLWSLKLKVKLSVQKHSSICSMLSYWSKCAFIKGNAKFIPYFFCLLLKWTTPLKKLSNESVEYVQIMVTLTLQISSLTTWQGWWGCKNQVVFLMLLTMLLVEADLYHILLPPWEFIVILWLAFWNRRVEQGSLSR